MLLSSSRVQSNTELVWVQATRKQVQSLGRRPALRSTTVQHDSNGPLARHRYRQPSTRSFIQKHTGPVPATHLYLTIFAANRPGERISICHRQDWSHVSQHALNSSSSNPGCLRLLAVSSARHPIMSTPAVPEHQRRLAGQGCQSETIRVEPGTYAPRVQWPPPCLSVVTSAQAA